MGVEVESREVDAQAKVGVRNGKVEKKETSLVKWWKIDDASFSRFFNIIRLFHLKKNWLQHALWMDRRTGVDSGVSGVRGHIRKAKGEKQKAEVYSECVWESNSRIVEIVETEVGEME